MIQSFPRRMAVPMAERLTMARLCLRPMPHHHPPTASLVRILRHLSSGLKSRRARQRGTSLTFIIYDRYFSQAQARRVHPARASERKVADEMSRLLIDASLRKEDRPIPLEAALYTRVLPPFLASSFNLSGLAIAMKR